MNNNYYLKRYPLDGVGNFRDLGGYPAKLRMTKYGIFFRSSHWNKATPQDLGVLESLGIKTVVDLRYPSEIEEFPEVKVKSCSYFNFSILGTTTIDQITVKDWVVDTKTLYSMYKQIVETGKSEIKQALKLLIDAEGPTLFHCASGKDRTGIISMLLLSLVGVEEMDIVADYEISHTLVRKYTDDISGSHYRNMENLLTYLTKTYGSVPDFAKSIGITNDDINCLIDKYTVPLNW